MQPGKNIYLVGMPACGKSTWGRRLAMAWRWHFIDLDDYIAQQAGKSIPEIFEEQGEKHFRQLEREALRVIATSEIQTVISTGGGTPCFFDNMDLILAQGVSVFLDTPLEVLLRRLESKANKRPLFAQQDRRELEQGVREKLSHRLPFYQKANLRIPYDEMTLPNLSDQLRFWMLKGDQKY